MNWLRHSPAPLFAPDKDGDGGNITSLDAPHVEDEPKVEDEESEEESEDDSKGSEDETTGNEGESSKEEDAKRERTEAFYQTKYQDLIAQANAKDEEDEDEDLSTDAPSEEDNESTLMDVSRAELENSLVDKIVPRVVAANVKAIKEMSRKDRQREKLADTKKAAAELVSTYVGENKLTKDEVDAVVAKVSQFGFDMNSPLGVTQFAQSVHSNLENVALRKGAGERVTTDGRRAEDQARTAALASSPPKGAAPPAAKRTKKQQLLDSMFSIERSDVRSLLDSSREN